MAAQQHVMIAGFGRTGQSLAKLLEEEGIAYQALDLDPDRVREAQAAGANVSYGDAGAARKPGGGRHQSCRGAGDHLRQYAFGA